MKMSRCPSMSPDGPPLAAPRSFLRPACPAHRRTVRPGGCSDAKIAAKTKLALAAPLSGLFGCRSPA